MNNPKQIGGSRSTVILGVIAALASILVSIFAAFAAVEFSVLWSRFLFFMEWVGNVVMSSYSLSLPGWAWGVVCPLLIIMFVIVVRVIVSKVAKPAYASYVKDNIDGLEWHWRWEKSHIKDRPWSIEDLRCLCSDCKGELIWQEDFFLVYKLICEHCQCLVMVIPRNKHDELNRVKREIHRRIRNKSR